MSGEHEGLPSDGMDVKRSGLMDAAVKPAVSMSGTRRARLLRGGAVFTALALVVVALVYASWRAIPPAPPAQVTPTAVARFLPATGLACVQDVAWSPNSAYIALVGSANGFCGYGGYAPNVVNVYRVRTAELVRQLHPDAAVFAALGMPPPSPATPNPQGPPQWPQLTYQTISWSPDGARLAIAFTLSNGYSPTGQFQPRTGLVLLGADGSHGRVLVDRSGLSQQAVYAVWDLQAGTISVVPTPPPPIEAQSFTPISLPPALSYTWKSDGSLEPGTPLSASVQPPAALDLVGNPDGGRSFGVWQPGQVQVIAILTAGQQTSTYLYVFQTTFAAWSPDGRYFVDQLNMSGLLLPAGQPAPSQAVLSAAQLDGAPALPIRDAALQQAIAHDIELPGELGPNAPSDYAPLAWRPDGKVLAILNQGNGFTLRSTMTGRIVKSLGFVDRPPSSLAPAGAFGTSANILSWSPDGDWLLLPSLGLVDVGHLSV